MLFAAQLGVDNRDPLSHALDPDAAAHVRLADLGRLRVAWTTDFGQLLPCGVDDHGMPFGLQVVGRFGGDIELLDAAGALERAFEGIADLRRPRPDISALATPRPALKSIMTDPPAQP